MSEAALDELIAAERTLIAALDAGDVEAIERGTTEYAAAVRRVQAIGGWRARPEAKARVVEALTLAESARVRVNVLADATRRRLAMLARANGRETRIGYGRNGRLTA